MRKFIWGVVGVAAVSLVGSWTLPAAGAVPSYVSQTLPQHSGWLSHGDASFFQSQYAYPYGYRPTTGGLRLEVEPKSAEVYVDGNYAGVVSDFDGRFHHLELTAGGHQVELRAPGYQTRELDIYVQPDHVTDWKGSLTRSVNGQ